MRMNEKQSQMKPKQPMINRQPPMQMMNQLPPPQMMPMPIPIINRNYGNNCMWPQPPPLNNPPIDPPMFPNPFTASRPRRNINNNWQGKKPMDTQNNYQVPYNINNLGNQHLPSGGYQPPNLLELQAQNRSKARKHYNPKKKFNTNNRFAPYAPRNTSSFIIRAKKSGGIASLVSPCPVTPAVLPTPVFSPSTEVLGDTAKEEWGVDGYGSMNGLIRLRSPGSGLEGDDDGSSDSESDVEEHVEVERRLDHDLSRFEMIYPNGPNGDYNNLLENRVDDQDTHIAHLEEENLTLKERLFLMEREMRDMRRRMQSLERLTLSSGNATEEVVENGSDNDAESSGRGEDRQLVVEVGGNDELEYVVEEHPKVDDQGCEMVNANVAAEDVLENQDGIYPNDKIELSGQAVQEKVNGDASMDESETVSEQDKDEVEISGANHNESVIEESNGEFSCAET